MLIFRNCLKSVTNIQFLFATAKQKRQKTFYQMLEVPNNATQTAIKKNYIKLAKLYHPDVYKGADKTRFQKIKEAYEILSDQTKRSQYDQSIGLQPSPSYPTQEQSESPTSDSENQYGKPKNEFKYTKPKVEINIDEEYQKFFKKKSKTHFQQIRLHQSTQFKAMSQKQRVRRRFAEIYPDLNLAHKMKFSKSYSQILDDQINQKNTYQQELKDKKQAYEKKYTEQNILKKQKYIIIGGSLTFLLMLPFIYSFKSKLKLQREAKQNYQKKAQQFLQEVEHSEIRQRLRFK